MRQFLQRHWFLIGLGLVLAVGLAAPQTFEFATRAVAVRNLIVAAVLLMTTITLPTPAIWQSLRYPLPALLAVAINFVLVPLVAWFFSQALRGDLALGLIVASVAPCTLVSAAVWTRMAGGNDAVAILVTVITNLLCFVVTPLWLVVLTGRDDVQISYSVMATKLSLLVVLPMVLGQLLRQRARIADWVDRRKRRISQISQLGLLWVVLVGAISAGLRLRQMDSQAGTSLGDLARMLALTILLHLLVLGIAYLLAGLLGVAHPDQIAVAFAGSQKTLMVGLYVALQFGGLVVLPMVAYHVCQLVIDTFVAQQLARRPPSGDPS